MNAFLQQLARLGPARLIIMFGVAAGVAGALTIISTGIGGGDKSLLFANLDLTESAEVIGRLEQAGIGYDLEAGGSAIFVDSRQVLDARLMLAAEGLPGQGSIGYEIFDQQSALGATQFVQNINRIRALEGELARTIIRVQGVSSARVHLAIPERRMFDREGSQPTASVFLELRGANLGARNARAIRNLVASAVPDLQASRVTILDGEGRLLHDGMAEDPEAAAASAMDDRKVAFEDRTRRQLLDLVESVVGVGNARIQVTADMDFNRVTESEEVFDPAGQVVRSTRVEENSTDESDTETDGQATIAENVPALADDDALDPGRASTSAARGLVEVTNFEISRRTRNAIREVGAVTRLSVAVAVNDVSSVGEDGAAEITPRTAAQLEQIATLVRSAIGFDAQRGDVVEVVNVGFAPPAMIDTGASAPAPMGLTAQDLMRGLELLVLAIVAAMVILLVARPLLKAATPSASTALVPAGSTALEDPTPVDAQDGPVALVAPEDMDDEELVQVANIEGSLKASSVSKVAKVVNDNQDKSVAILRQWLHES